jgi:hypothetical protein
MTSDVTSRNAKGTCSFNHFKKAKQVNLWKLRELPVNSEEEIERADENQSRLHRCETHYDSGLGPKDHRQQAASDAYIRWSDIYI